MLILLPIGLLLIAALAITIQQRARPNFGTSWLIAASASIAAWLMVLVLRFRLPTTLEVLSWDNADSNLLGHFSFLLDYNSWPYILALLTITLAVILTGAARTRYDSTPQSWAASLTITALGLIALQSGSSLTLMASWALVDLVELIYLLRLEDASQFTFRILASYAVRMASILLIFIGTIIGWQTFPNFDITQIPQSAAFLFLLAAGFRLGVFPLNLPFLQEPGMRRGAGNILRLAPVASSLVLLARLPENIIPAEVQGWTWAFYALLAIAALYAAFRWLSAADEIEGRPFWIVAWASLAVASVLNGKPQASLAWGLALILPGSLFFLYFPRVQRMNFLLFFGLIGLVGLPYTPLASGWIGLVGNGATLWTFIFLIAHAIMIFGTVNRALQPGGEAGSLETWARIAYPLGFIIIIQAMIILGLVGWPGSLTLGLWWPPAVSLGLVIGATILIRRYGIEPPYIQLPASSGLAKILDWIQPRLEAIFRLEWVYRVILWFFNLFGKILRYISIIIEGQGGILWTILLLVLLITLLSTGRTP